MNIFFTAIIFMHLTLTWAQEKTQEKPLPPELQKNLNEMKKGRMERKKVLKIAEGILRHGDSAKASELYAEYSKEKDEDQVIFNRATALLKQGKVDEAMPFVQDLLKNAKDESVKDKMRSNLLLALQTDKNDQNQKNDKQKEDDKNKDDQNKKDQKDNKDGQKNQNDKQQDDKKDGQNQKDQEQKKDKSNQNKDQEKDKDKDKDKDKKDPQDLKKPEEKTPQTLEEKEKKIELQRKMVKTPAMVKQIMNDDRELQRMMMDTSTNERGQSKPKRDW